MNIKNVFVYFDALKNIFHELRHIKNQLYKRYWPILISYMYEGKVCINVQFCFLSQGNVLLNVCD